MGTLKKAILLAVMAGIALPAMADEKQRSACDPATTIEFEKHGKLNEEELQKQIDGLKEQLEKARSLGGPLSLKKARMRQHLQAMRDAMTKLHNQMYAEGCQSAIHGASLEARVTVLEKRLNMMEQMMSQLIENLSEQQEESSE